MFIPESDILDMTEPHPSPYDPKRGVCAHLGFREDRETWHAFPSQENVCHAGVMVRSVTNPHQVTFCMSVQCADCPVYQKAQTPVEKTIRIFPSTWIQQVSGAAFVWVLIGWMVRLILH